MKFRFLSAVFVCLPILIFNTASAELISFNSIDNGWYDESGVHTPSNTNTLTGICCGSGNHNSFFNFNLDNFLQNVVINNASITFFQNGDYVSADASETLQLFDVTSTPGAGNSLAVYDDLMTGILYGVAEVSSNAEFTVSLSALSFADILNDNFFSIGAHLATAIGEQSIFSSSNGVGVASLNVDYTTQSEPIPEPSTFAIFALGIIGLASRRFKKQS
jgi:hypothetical protein